MKKKKYISIFVDEINPGRHQPTPVLPVDVVNIERITANGQQYPARQLNLFHRTSPFSYSEK